GPGTAAQAFGMQQARDVQHGLLAHGQRGGVCDTHLRRRTLLKLICERTTFIPGFCVFLLHHNRYGVSQPSQSMTTYGAPAVTRNGSMASSPPSVKMRSRR